MTLWPLCTTGLRISVSVLGHASLSSGQYSLESQDPAFLAALRSSPHPYVLGWPEFLGFSGPVLPFLLSFPAVEEDIMCWSLHHLQGLSPKPLAPHIPEYMTH